MEYEMAGFRWLAPEEIMTWRPWADLPAELLSTIFQSLSLKYLIRCSTICIPWCSVAEEVKVSYKDANPQIPWLFLPNFYSGKKSVIRKFFDLESEETHNIILPELYNCKVIGSSESFLIVGQETTANIFAFNPITRERIDFAPASTLPYVLAVEHQPRKKNKQMVNYFFVRDKGSNIRSKVSAEELTTNFSKAILLTTYVTDVQGSIDRIATIVLLHCDGRMTLTRKGDYYWIALESYLNIPPPKDIMFLNGLLYAIDPFGRITTYALNDEIHDDDDDDDEEEMIPLMLVSRGPDLHHLIPDDEEAEKKIFRYFVSIPEENSHGTLLQVCLLRMSPEVDTEDICIIFKLEVSANRGRWVEMEWLPEGFSLLVNEWPEPYMSTTLHPPGDSKFIRKNCIYVPMKRYIKVIHLDVDKGHCKPVYYRKHTRCLPKYYKQPSVWITASL